MNSKQRLDKALADRKIATTRSQAESWIKLGLVAVDGRVVTKPGHFVGESADIRLNAKEQYVSRAGLKLASVAELLGVNFSGKVVLDVGSSTGGFTDYSLQHGAKKVLAVDVGSDQLHPSLRSNPKIDLHEKTDIRSFKPSITPDIVLIDVSFISLREILPHVASISGPRTQILAMVKPQFEAGRDQVNKGVIKNDSVRRQILRDFESWLKQGQGLVVVDKRDSEVSGSKGNRERFYKLSTGVRV